MTGYPGHDQEACTYQIVLNLSVNGMYDKLVWKFFIWISWVFILRPPLVYNILISQK